jgi:hypothetical protein
MTKPRDRYSVLRNTGKFTGTIKRALEIRADRDFLATNVPPLPGIVPIPLGPNDKIRVRVAVENDHSRRKNWTSAESTIARLPNGYGVTENDNGKYAGKRYSKYTHWTYTPIATAYARAVGSRLVGRIWNTPIKLRAPRGWIFGTDELGIYVIRTKENRISRRCHIDSDDMRGGIAAIRRKGIEHENRQKEADRGDKNHRTTRKNFEVAQKLGIWISPKDSYDAGNCSIGTSAWMRNQCLPSKKYYRVELIKRLAHTHPLVSRAIRQAEIRATDDITRGYCEI